MNDKLLQQIAKLFESHTAQLRSEIQQVKVELKEGINRSQEDTINALTTLMNEGYDNHEKRIQTLEKKFAISHPQYLESLK